MRATVRDGKRQYEPDPDGPVGRELGRLVLQTRGRVPRIRHALVQLRTRSIAWAVAGSSTTPHTAPVARGALIVLTGAPRPLVRVQLANVVDGAMEIHIMTTSEWVARLGKGDVFLRRARRARKLWILGSWQDLVDREAVELEAKRALQTARKNWREELSDEWDEDWDPFAPAPGKS